MNQLDLAIPSRSSDHAEWLSYQIAALLRNDMDKLDVENLREELEGILNSQRKELMHRLQVLTVHLLKCEFQPQRKGRSWLSTIATQRTCICMLLRGNPSLRKRVTEFALAGYTSAVKEAALQTGLSKSAFPDTMPYSEEQLMDDDFVPGTGDVPAAR